MKNKHMGLKRYTITVSGPRRLANFAKEKGKEDHHILTDHDELIELFTFHKSLVCFVIVIENFS